MLHRDLYTFNHSVDDDIPQKPEKKSTENVDALSWLFSVAENSIFVNLIIYV